MSPDPARWRTIEHTADLAIEVEAPTPDALFVGAARALVGLLMGIEEDGSAETAPAEPSVWRELSLESADRASLLVDWLRELLWIQESEDVLFSTAEFRELGERRLTARVGFTPLSDRAALQRELKGVTYHDLEVAEGEGGWYARIVFDV